MQALDAFRKLRLEKVQEVKECKLKLEHLRTHKESAHKLRAEVEQGRQREQALEAQIQGLEDQLQQHKQVQLRPPNHWAQGSFPQSCHPSLEGAWISKMREAR